MTITPVATDASNYNDTVTSQVVAYSGANAVGNLLVCWGYYLGANAGASAVMNISDTTGNPWTLIKRLDSSVRSSAYWMRYAKTTATPTVTLSSSGTTQDIGLIVTEWNSNIRTLSLDPNCLSYGSGTSASPALPSMRPIYKSTIIIASCNGQQQIITPGSGWTDWDNLQHTEMAYQINTSVPAAQTPNWAQSGGSAGYNAIAITFTDAVVVPGLSQYGADA